MATSSFFPDQLTPTEALDVANLKEQVEVLVEQAETAKEGAELAQINSESQAGLANAHKNSASASETLATQKATEASNSATLAQGYANSASQSVTDASAQVGLASAQRVIAENAKTASELARDEAQGHATTAAGQITTTTANANSASASATTASNAQLAAESARDIAVQAKDDNVAALGNYYTKTEIDAVTSTKANSADVYTKAEANTNLSSAVTVLETKLDTKLTKREITYISPSQHNNLMIVADGRLYTTSGTGVVNSNSGTGRGLTGQVTHISMENIKEVIFPNLPDGASLLEVGGNGYSVHYALFDNGYLYTWGHNGYGQCGLGHTSPVATPTLALNDCTKVHNSLMTDEYDVTDSCLIVERADGYVYGTGNNNDGQLGIGTSNYNTFQQMTWLGTSPKSVWCNQGYGAGLIAQKADGTIWAAGNGLNGKLFTGVSQTGVSTPIEITNNIGGISAGDLVFVMDNYAYYTGAESQRAGAVLMRKTDAGVTSIYTVGNNDWGQRGDGTKTTSATPYLVPNMDDVVDIISHGGAVRKTHVLKANGDLYGWGHNGEGQVGVGSTSDVLSPTLVMTGVDQILTRNVTSQRYDHRTQMFVRKGSDIYCWGFETPISYLGMGLSSNVTSPTKHPYLSNPRDPVKMLGTFTTDHEGRVLVAITEKNNILAWGYNANNGLSPDTTLAVKYPTQFDLPQENS